MIDLEEHKKRYRKAQAEAAAGVAKALPLVPSESVEDQLVTFDMFITLQGDAWRPEAAALLRGAAGQCEEADRRDRLLRAADDVAEGVACARTPEGLTAEEAAAVNTTTQDDSKSWMKGEPLTVWDLYRGMVIRVKQGFRDFDGQEIAAGEVLHFRERSYFPYDGGHTLYFEERVIRLADIMPANVPVIRNEDGAYYERVREG